MISSPPMPKRRGHAALPASISSVNEALNAFRESPYDAVTRQVLEPRSPHQYPLQKAPKISVLNRYHATPQGAASKFLLGKTSTILACSPPPPPPALYAPPVPWQHTLTSNGAHETQQKSSSRYTAREVAGSNSFYSHNMKNNNARPMQGSKVQAVGHSNMAPVMPRTTLRGTSVLLHPPAPKPSPQQQRLDCSATPLRTVRYRYSASKQIQSTLRGDYRTLNSAADPHRSSVRSAAAEEILTRQPTLPSTSQPNRRPASKQRSSMVYPALSHSNEGRTRNNNKEARTPKAVPETFATVTHPTLVFRRPQLRGGNSLDVALEHQPVPLALRVPRPGPQPALLPPRPMGPRSNVGRPVAGAPLFTPNYTIVGNPRTSKAHTSATTPISRPSVPVSSLKQFTRGPSVSTRASFSPQNIRRNIPPPPLSLTQKTTTARLVNEQPASPAIRGSQAPSSADTTTPRLRAKPFNRQPTASLARQRPLALRNIHPSTAYRSGSLHRSSSLKRTVRSTTATRKESPEYQDAGNSLVWKQSVRLSKRAESPARRGILVSSNKTRSPPSLRSFPPAPARIIRPDALRRHQTRTRGGMVHICSPSTIANSEAQSENSTVNSGLNSFNPSSASGSFSDSSLFIGPLIDPEEDVTRLFSKQHKVVLEPLCHSKSSAISSTSSSCYSASKESSYSSSCLSSSSILLDLPRRGDRTSVDTIASSAPPATPEARVATLPVVADDTDRDQQRATNRSPNYESICLTSTALKPIRKVFVAPRTQEVLPTFELASPRGDTSPRASVTRWLSDNQGYESSLLRSESPTSSSQPSVHCSCPDEDVLNINRETPALSADPGELDEAGKTWNRLAKMGMAMAISPLPSPLVESRLNGLADPSLDLEDVNNTPGLRKPMTSVYTSSDFDFVSKDNFINGSGRPRRHSPGSLDLDSDLLRSRHPDLCEVDLPSSNEVDAGMRSVREAAAMNWIEELRARTWEPRPKDSCIDKIVAEFAHEAMHPDVRRARQALKVA